MKRTASLIMLRIERAPALALELTPGVLLIAGGLLVMCLASVTR